MRSEGRVHIGPSQARSRQFFLELQTLCRELGPKACLLDPIAASVWRIRLLDLYAQLQFHCYNQTPWVLHPGEVPFPDFQVPRPEAPPPAAGTDTDEPSPAPDSDGWESPPDLLCISVVIVHFQCTSSWHQLWYERGEHIDSLMVRARILLNSDPDAFSLEAVQPQPPGGHLTLLGFPSWWTQVGIRPMLLHRRFPAAPDFVLPSFPHQIADAFIPSTRRHRLFVFNRKVIQPSTFRAFSNICSRSATPQLPSTEPGRARTLSPGLRSSWVLTSTISLWSWLRVRSCNISPQLCKFHEPTSILSASGQRLTPLWSRGDDLPPVLDTATSGT